MYKIKDVIEEAVEIILLHHLLHLQKEVIQSITY